MEDVPISGLSRRTFVLGGLALLGACTASGKRPPLEQIYRRRPNRAQPPLIVIPGAFGSRLFDTRTGEEIWPRSSARLLFSSYKGLEVEIDEATLDPIATHIRPYSVFREGLGRDFYGQILDTLENIGGYRRRHAGQPVEADQRNYYLYLYDWRLDNVAAVAGLHELIERIRDDYRDPKLQVDILAHSNGGLLARYYARFGAVDHLGSSAAAPDYAGAPAIRRLLMVGTPNLGSMQPVLSHVRGEEMGFRKIPAEVVATTSGAPQLMPHPAVPWLVGTDGGVITADLFDIATWREFGWSIFDAKVRERTIARKGGGRAGQRYLGLLEDYLARHLVRGRNFHLLMGRAGDARDTLPFVFGGDCELTVARLVAERVRGRWIAHERPETLRSPLSGIDYQELIFAPGDGVVTRSSLLGRAVPPLLAGSDPIVALPLAQSMFLCEQHQFLTGNATFQNNLLHTLFAADAEAARPRPGVRPDALA